MRIFFAFLILAIIDLKSVCKNNVEKLLLCYLKL